jgi:hypothetical protein
MKAIRHVLPACCARAVTGHASALPSSMMNSRRLTGISDNLGWNGVWLRGYRYTGLDVIVPPEKGPRQTGRPPPDLFTLGQVLAIATHFAVAASAKRDCP